MDQSEGNSSYPLLPPAHPRSSCSLHPPAPAHLFSLLCSAVHIMYTYGVWVWSTYTYVPSYYYTELEVAHSLIFLGIFGSHLLALLLMTPRSTLESMEYIYVHAICIHTVLETLCWNSLWSSKCVDAWLLYMYYCRLIISQISIRIIVSIISVLILVY